MLTPADLALVLRDPGLAGLSLLLDSDAFSAWLSERTGAPCRALPRRLRYKPGVSCVLAFDLARAADGGARTEPCMAKTYADEARSKAEKSVSDTPPDEVLALDPGLPLVVTTLAGDRHLPALALLQDPHTRGALLRRLFPGGPDLTDARLTTLRHNPERRWVGLVESGQVAPFVLRAYRPDKIRHHVRAYEQTGGDLPRTPRLLGTSRRYGLVAVEWAEGSALVNEEPDIVGFGAAGRALAQLHERPRPHLEWSRPEAHANEVLKSGRQVAALLPELGAEASALATRLASELRLIKQGKKMLHGDFSVDQTVLGRTDRVSLIDLDSAVVGHPAFDLGCAWSASIAGVGCTDDDAGFRAAIDAMHTGYDSVRPLPGHSAIAVHGAAHLLRRAAEPFRRRDPNWPEQMHRKVALAQDSLSSATRGGL